jgi:hypothetical protein
MSWRRRAAYAYPLLLVAFAAVVLSGVALLGGFDPDCDFMDGGLPDSCTDADSAGLLIVFIGGPIAIGTLLLWAVWMTSLAVRRKRAEKVVGGSFGT